VRRPKSNQFRSVGHENTGLRSSLCLVDAPAIGACGQSAIRFRLVIIMAIDCKKERWRELIS